jgi:hypothetical protein
VNIASKKITKTEKSLGVLNRCRALPFGNNFDFIVGRSLSIFTNQMTEVFEFVARKFLWSRNRMLWDAIRERVMSRSCM